MNVVVDLLRILLPTAYALAVVAYVSLFMRDDPWARRVATPLLSATVVLHAVFIVFRGLTVHRQPIGSPLEVMTVIAFAVALVHLLIELTHKNQGAGAFVISAVFLFQLIASAFTGKVEPAATYNPILASPWFGVHSGSAILGYSGFAVSAAYGLLFLLLYREIKASHFGRIYERLPSLELLATMTVRAAAVGLACLSLAIAAGIIWSVQLQFEFFRDPKFVVTVLLWIVYSACVGAHYVLRWHERRVVYFSLVGFVIMLFSMAAVNVLFRSFHTFA